MYVYASRATKQSKPKRDEAAAAGKKLNRVCMHARGEFLENYKYPWNWTSLNRKKCPESYLSCARRALSDVYIPHRLALSLSLSTLRRGIVEREQHYKSRRRRRNERHARAPLSLSLSLSLSRGHEIVRPGEGLWCSIERAAHFVRCGAASRIFPLVMLARWVS